MRTLKAFIYPFVAMAGLEVLQIYKEIQPLLFDILQWVIAVLTIIWLVYRIRNEKRTWQSGQKRHNKRSFKRPLK